jgi:hypothetical protein
LAEVIRIDGFRLAILAMHFFGLTPPDKVGLSVCAAIEAENFWSVTILYSHSHFLFFTNLNEAPVAFVAALEDSTLSLAALKNVSSK